MKNLRNSERLSKRRSAAKSGVFSLTRLSPERLPRLDFGAMAIAILGPHYSCSLVVVDDTESQRLNNVYRKKSYIPNVLSFPLARDTGEIFLNLKEARRQMHDPNGIPREEGLSFPQWTTRLVIHGMLHLKGLPHGSRMDKAERRFLKIFSVEDRDS